MVISRNSWYWRAWLCVCRYFSWLSNDEYDAEAEERGAASVPMPMYLVIAVAITFWCLCLTLSLPFAGAWRRVNKPISFKD